MHTLISWNALAFYAMALVGIFAHAFKKWIWREINYSVWEYLFKVDPRATLATVATAISTIAGMVAHGVLVDPNDGTQAFLAIATAFGIDSVVLPATAGIKAPAGTMAPPIQKPSAPAE